MSSLCSSASAVRQLSQQDLVARQLVHARDQQRVLLKRRGAEHRLAELRGENLKREAELQIQLVLPLVHQATGRDDQTALDVLSEDQLLDVEAGHDRLARARVIGQQEPQRRARQQLAIDRPQLMRQRLDV
jgi:hypothetical protein